MDAAPKWPRVVAALACCASWGWLALVLPVLSEDPGRPGIVRLVVTLSGIAVNLLQLGIGLPAVVRRRWRARAWGWAGLSATGLFLVAAYTDLPFRGRLWLSESALRQYMAGPPGDDMSGGSAGLYQFERVIRTEDGAVYFITGYNFKDPYGFVYLPPGVTAHQPVEHVFGPWCWFDRW
jgi:hypothetical protein